MLTHIDTLLAHNMFDDERASMIKAIEDIFHGRYENSSGKKTCESLSQEPASCDARTLPGSSGKRRNVARIPVSMLHQSEGRMHYELVSVVPIKQSLAVVKIRQTPLDRHGRRIEEATSSPLMVIAKSGDEWEMVGLPLPRHCLLYSG